MKIELDKSEILTLIMCVIHYIEGYPSDFKGSIAYRKLKKLEKKLSNAWRMGYIWST